MAHRIWMTTAFAAMISLVCAWPESPQAAEPPAGQAAATSPAAEDMSVGTAAFSVNGASRQFTHAPARDNRYTSLSSVLVLKPSPGTTEQLMVTFLSINLREVTFPADLPLPRDPRRPSTNPLAATANVGFSYTAADGQEWAGPGRLHVAAFGADGVIEGRFADISLPHTGKARPRVVLSDGTFRVRIAGR